MPLKTIALVLFILMYVLLLALPKYRTYVALAVAAIFVAIGVVPFKTALMSIDWNVIMMIGGTMGIVFLFIESKMPALLADKLIDKMPNVKWAVVALSLFAGFVSAFVDNVATVLMVVPVAFIISKKLNISPVPSVIAIAVSSNLQGAATLVGDTTSIMLGGYAGMDFNDFFVFHGKASIFWGVELGALASAFILLWIFRKDNAPVKIEEFTKVEDYFPSVIMVGVVLLLIVASFFKNKPEITNGVICMSLFIIGLIYETIKNKDKKLNLTLRAFKDIDYITLGLLAGLFVVISGIKEVGIIDDISKLFIKVGGNNIFLMYSLIVWASVLISAFIDNIPYVATMLPVVQGIAVAMSANPILLYFGLLTGATLGGNLSPIGASANITAIGMLRKNGHEVKTKDFMKIGVPFTLSAVLVGYLFVWFVWRNS